MAATYYIGNQVVRTFTVTDANGNLVDPGTITYTLTDPTGAVTTPAITHASTGTYTYSFTPTVSGHYSELIVTTGTGAAEVASYFDVVSGQVTLSTVTFKAVIDEVITNLHGFTSDLEQVTNLAQNITTTDTSFNVGDISQISRGLIEIDSELLWVSSVNQQTGTVTIAPFGRGFRETSAAAHSLNAMVTNNPRFPRQAVKQAINQVLTSIYPNVFQVLTDESNTVNPVRISYPVPSNCDVVLDVRWKTVGPSQLWKPVKAYKLDAKADNTVFPTGKSLEIYDGMMPGRSIKVTYMAVPGQFANETDTLGMVGLSDTARDILIYGACYRLVSNLEAARLQTWSVTQAARDGLVPPGSAMNASKFYFMLYQQRLHDEEMRLQKLYRTSLHKVRR